MKLVNDQSCSWIKDLPTRSNIKTLKKNINCDWLIIGAGYTGLSAARKLAEIHPNQTIVVVDAQLAGEGASGRNSGYLVDTTLNDGFSSNKELESYKKKSDIYQLGIKSVRDFMREHQVDCDWNAAGKYFASSKNQDQITLNNFSKTLSKLGFQFNFLNQNELKKKLGTNFYNSALYTPGGILLHPGKLVRAMIDVLPHNVTLYENSMLLNWSKHKDSIIANFESGKISSKKIIFCTNGFLKSLGIKSSYNFPITLTASMTRALTDNEFQSIGSPKEWGILPVRHLGATLRMTNDRRILIRNTAEVSSPFEMQKSKLHKRINIHKKGIEKRFPQLPKDLIFSSWSGVVSRTRNGSQVFEKIDSNIFVAGCYNGSGIGVGTLFGEQIAIKASNEQSIEMQIIESRSKPTFLPPQPFLDIGVRARLVYERLRARADV